jgi:hypothetical protein
MMQIGVVALRHFECGNRIAVGVPWDMQRERRAILLEAVRNIMVASNGKAAIRHRRPHVCIRRQIVLLIELDQQFAQIARESRCFVELTL